MRGSAPDLEVNCAVRRVFIRHWIDLGRLSFRTQKGRVTIRGIMDRISGTEQPLDVQTVETIFAELQRVRGVERVVTELSNWEKTSTGWKSIKTQIIPSATAQSSDRRFVIPSADAKPLSGKPAE